MIRRESWPSVRSCAGSPELRQLSQPDQIPGVPGATDARSISGDSDPQRLRDWTVHLTGVGITSASPSTPTGISSVSASTITSNPVP